MLLGPRASRRTNAACLEGVIYQRGPSKLPPLPLQTILLAGSGQAAFFTSNTSKYWTHRDQREVVQPSIADHPAEHCCVSHRPMQSTCLQKPCHGQGKHDSTYSSKAFLPSRESENEPEIGAVPLWTPILQYVMLPDGCHPEHSCEFHLHCCYSVLSSSC